MKPAHHLQIEKVVHYCSRKFCLLNIELQHMILVPGLEFRKNFSTDLSNQRNRVEYTHESQKKFGGIHSILGRRF